MKHPTHDTDPLVQAFADRRTRPATTEPDPTAEDVWDAVNGDLPADETQHLLDRTIADPRLALEWRLARALGEELRADAQNEEQVDAPRLRGRWRTPLLWAASLLFAVVSLVYVLQPPPDSSVYRDPGQTSIESQLAPGATVDRNGTVLRWRGPAGARFEISVVREDDLSEVFAARDLTVSEVTIPAAVLRSLPVDLVLLWRVEATLEDGTQIDSPTFRIGRDTMQ